MKQAPSMDALQLARVMKDMAHAQDLATLASAFLQAAIQAHGLSAGLCYWRSADGQMLIPLAFTGGSVELLPLICMEELDNPLVYSLIASQVCKVEKLSELIEVGEGFEKLCMMQVTTDGLLAFPLHDHRRQSAGVLVLIGSDRSLQAWESALAWQLLLQTVQQLGARILEHAGTTDSARAQQAQAHARDSERSRARAARLLAAGFVGMSRTAKDLRNEMLRVADSSLSLLITGETGAGKDHAAWLIHQASARDGKFVPVNCAAIPKDLIEAELFGVVRGAYTGATAARNGLVAEAHGGTLFLDEIGDMPLELQGTLLRLLNEKKFRPVGATREQGSDFRLICATHRPLPERVRDGGFREDLYFRIRQHTLHLPPLRERCEDIAVMVSHILLQFNREAQRNVMGVSARALAMLQAYPFPGNVRELRSLILAAAEHTPPGSLIRSNTLVALQSPALQGAVDQSDDSDKLRELWDTDNLPRALEDFERRLLLDRLRKAEGSRRLAAESLGIPKRTLARKCQTWKLDNEEHATT